MHFDLHAIETVLAAAAASTIGSFVIAVLVDDALGVLLAIFKPAKSEAGAFDLHKLPGFLRTQYGTREALALAGLVGTAAAAAAGAYLLRGGITSDALAGIAAAAMLAATKGAASMTLSVLKDVAAKGAALLG